MADDDQAAMNADANADWFLSPQAGFPQTSQLWFTVLLAIIGLFSEETVLKVKQVAETIFSKPERGADSRPQSDLNNPKNSQDTKE